MTTTLPELGKEYDVRLLGNLVVYVPVEEKHRPAEDDAAAMGTQRNASAGRPTP